MSLFLRLVWKPIFDYPDSAALSRVLHRNIILSLKIASINDRGSFLNAMAFSRYFIYYKDLDTFDVTQMNLPDLLRGIESTNSISIFISVPSRRRRRSNMS